MSKQRVIVVLGMHRSGTSAITRGLKTFSVELGDNLMPPAPNNNEKGFWEDLDINRFNEKLFTKIGSSWDRMTPVDAGRLSQEEFSAERYDAAALMERKLSASPIFGFKDPRTSVLLPFWKCIFDDMGLDDSYILAVRNPLEVAESLRKRDKFDKMLGLVLWLKYNWAAVENTEDRKRICVAYRNLMEDPLAQLSRMAITLDLPPPVPSSPAVFEYVSEFLAHDLRHNRISDNEIRRSASIPQAVQSLYELLLKWSNEDAVGEVPAKVKTQIKGYLMATHPLLKLGDTLKGQAANSERHRTELAASLEQTKGKLSEREQRITGLEAAEAAARQNIEALKEDLQTVSTELSEREQHIATLEDAKAAALKEIETLKENFQTVSERLSEREQRIAGLEAAEAAARQNIETLKEDLQTVSTELSEREQHITSLEDAKAAALEEIETLKENFQTVSERLSEREQRIAGLEAMEATARKEAAHLFGQVQDGTASLAERDKKLAEAKTAITELKADLSEKTTMLRLARHQALEARTASEDRDARVQQQLAEATAEILQLRTQLEKYKRDHLQAETRLKALQSAEKRLKQTETALKTSEEALRRKHEELAASRQLATATQASLSASQTELADKKKTVRLLRHEVHALRSSTSWKLTKPIRILHALLTHPQQAFTRIVGKDGRGPMSNGS